MRLPNSHGDSTPFFESVVEKVNNQYVWFERYGGLLSAHKVGFSAGAPADIIPVEEYIIELEQSRYRSFEIRFGNVSCEHEKVYRFHITPFFAKPNALPIGQRPVLSKADSGADSSCWHRIGYDFEYIPYGQSLAKNCSALTCASQEAFTLSFSIKFPADTSLSNTLILAYNQPYGARDLNRSMNLLETSPHVKRSSLKGSTTEEGEDWADDETAKYPMLKITEHCDEQKVTTSNKIVLKPVVVLLSRSGAADVISSHAMDGCLYSLAFLRQKRWQN